MKQLLEMLTHARPHTSPAEQAFVNRYVVPVAPEHDAFGNHYRRIGNLPIVWSCHTDTVDRRPDRKKVELFDCIVRLRNGTAGTCLGADDTVGVWIMRRMIEAGRPGLYIFHRGEERGGLGSAWIADNEPERLDGIQAAIAFDRKGTQSIITHQLGARCCSARFANEIADVLDLDYRPDSTGMFTDTANYTHLVSECTNLSVGYEREHGPTETLDIDHAYLLRETMVRADFSAVGAYRDPTPWIQSRTRLSVNALESLVLDYPDIAAELLRDCGIDEEDFAQAIAYEDNHRR